MKHVDLWIDARKIPNSGRYSWTYYLAYDATDKSGNKQTAVVKDTGTSPAANNPKRATLYAFLYAIRKLHEPVDLTVHSRTQLGFKHPSKSTNSDCLMQIQAEITARGHLITIDENIEAKNFVRVIEFEKQYGSPEVALYYSEKIYGKDLKKQPQNQANQNQNKSKQQNQVRQQSKPKQPQPQQQPLQVNDVFEEADIANTGSWRDMYSDLMGPSQGTWVEGSGGY
jgi:hypothetical protein